MLCDWIVADRIQISTGAVASIVGELHSLSDKGGPDPDKPRGIHAKPKQSDQRCHG
jgi:hypothetical protein